MYDFVKVKRDVHDRLDVWEQRRNDSIKLAKLVLKFESTIRDGKRIPMHP